MSVEIQVMKWFPEEDPVGPSKSEEQEAQGYQVVVNGITLAVQKNAFLFPVEVQSVGVKKGGNVISMIVKSSTGLK